MGSPFNIKNEVTALYSNPRSYSFLAKNYLSSFSISSSESIQPHVSSPIYFTSSLVINNLFY